MRIEKALEDTTCYLGLDLSSTRDIAAIQAVWEIDEHYFTKGRYFAPRETVIEKEAQQNNRYGEWAEEGWITTCQGKTVDYFLIQDKIEELIRRYDVDLIGYDPWQAGQMAKALEERGAKTVEQRMGYKTMTKPTIELLFLIKNEKIHHNGNPVLTWMMENVVVRTDHRENMMPNKDASKEKIDGVVALLMGLDLCIRRKEIRTDSPYESHGLRTL